MVAIGVAESIEYQDTQESGCPLRYWDLVVLSGIGVLVLKRCRIFLHVQ